MFYLDEDISPRVAEIARGQCDLDVVSAHEVGTLEWPDDRQLGYAAREGRALVTRNRDDFISQTLVAYEARGLHAGVLIIPRRLPNDRFAAALYEYADVSRMGCRRTRSIFCEWAWKRESGQSSGRGRGGRQAEAAA
jgi:hypothetical protein